MRLIADGTIDREGVPGLAARLGYTTRQVERVLSAELGAGPLALARAQRAQTARLLTECTDLAFGRVAFAAGFSSIRQFNDTVRTVFGCPPSELRRRAAMIPAADSAGAIALRLPVRRPFSYTGLFGHLAATAVPGVEEVRAGTFRRTLRLPNATGIVALTPHQDHVACVLRLADFRDLPIAVARCRRLLDLDADPVPIAETLAGDPALAGAIAADPGRRIPRTVDEHELAIRVVLGQQVSVRAAGTLAARLASTRGLPITDPDGGLTHCFPTAAEIAGLDPNTLSMPESRRRTVLALAEALGNGAIPLGPGCDWAATRARLVGLPGIGPWSTELIAMRGLGDPDAFPASDLGVRTGARIIGLPSGAAVLATRAQSWRPWRSYATQYLWGAASSHPINQWPPKEAA